MSEAPRTWIVGTLDEHGVTTQCLLALEDRFLLPGTVAIDRGNRLVAAGTPGAAERVLAFVSARAGDGERGVDLLRDEEARALLEQSRDAAPRSRAGDPLIAAVAVDHRHAAPAIDQAVNLAVTTLIDWGHEIACRRAVASHPNHA
ncbi:MAG: hypothetical protein ACOCYE_12275 [Pseudomonadota bacterium]